MVCGFIQTELRASIGQRAPENLLGHGAGELQHAGQAEQPWLSWRPAAAGIGPFARLAILGKDMALVAMAKLSAPCAARCGCPLRIGVPMCRVNNDEHKNKQYNIEYSNHNDKYSD